MASKIFVVALLTLVILALARAVEQGNSSVPEKTTVSETQTRTKDETKVKPVQKSVADPQCDCQAALTIASAEDDSKNCSSSDTPWAEPRTEDIEWYSGMLNEFASEADEAKADKKKVKLVWYGDTLVQCMRYLSADCKGATTAYRNEYGKYRSFIWGLGSDTVGSLRWRLSNCNSPQDMDAKVVVLYIGVQDVLQADQELTSWEFSMDTIATKIISTSDYILNVTSEDTQVLLVGLLPITGYDRRGRPTMEMTTLTKRAMEIINDRLRAYGKSLDRVSYVDANHWFIRFDGTRIREQYMRGLLPTERGYRKIFDTLRPFVENYIN